MLITALEHNNTKSLKLSDYGFIVMLIATPTLNAPSNYLQYV